MIHRSMLIIVLVIVIVLIIEVFMILAHYKNIKRYFQKNLCSGKYPVFMWKETLFSYKPESLNEEVRYQLWGDSDKRTNLVRMASFPGIGPDSEPQVYATKRWYFQDLTIFRKFIVKSFIGLRSGCLL